MLLRRRPCYATKGQKVVTFKVERRPPLAGLGQPLVVGRRLILYALRARQVVALILGPGDEVARRSLTRLVTAPRRGGAGVVVAKGPLQFLPVGVRPKLTVTLGRQRRLAGLRR